LTDLDKRRPRGRNSDAGGALYNLPSSEIDRGTSRPDPWWLMPASLAMWALVALGVAMLMSALVA
jgi:hypothetical protein